MSLKGYLDAIEVFTSFKVLVIGDIMIDIYENCNTSESKLLYSEKPGKRAYLLQKAIKVLGGAGNVATTLSSLGVQTSLLGVSGNDENYFKIRELCELNLIDHFVVRDSSRPTTIKNRLYIDDEYLLRRDDEKAHKIDREISSVLMRGILHHIPNVNAVVLSDYNKGVFTEANTQEIIKECKMHKIPVIVDFKPVNKLLFAGADVISPNENEARELYSEFALNNLELGSKKILELLKCDSIVITLGKNGLCGYDNNGFFYVPGIKVKAYDAVGCGDTVRAVLALGLCSKLDLSDAAELANYAAAIIVQKPLTSTLSKVELTTFVTDCFNKKSL